MAQSFIGKPISLISHSDVRYRGILAGIDPQASTIQLSNVYSMGTESRRPPAEFIPPVQEPYQYIIFRASEVKDLAVDEPTPRRSVHDDPAVLVRPIATSREQLTDIFHIQAAPQGPIHASPYPAPAQQQPQPQQHPAPQAYPAPVPQPQHPPPPQQQQQQQQHVPAPPAQRRSNSVHTAAASLETVERALGDLRVSQNNANANCGRGGGRGGRGRGRQDGAGGAQIKVPTTDFDFASSNAKFDKAALTPKTGGSGAVTPAAEGEDAKDDKEDGESKDKEKEKEKESAAYNPSKSFFDSLSSGSQGGGGAGNNNGGGGRGRRGGRGGAGRNRREEERERNVATFGEPGGVGLLGPGAYVGGWGGYGRRGGRPRRGGGAPAPQATGVPARG
ncbi:hypothetical protein H0H81_001636 [Sphagnurus paluster]|uniref:Uncharacterized protein n=1 Tax=Sphagnurus paluster TaxID=117069 RepID=A0A9P7KGT5_9AGAR|nr:hypothetical protein H0H81_001636 [Sphagnurus paluster]